MQDALPDRMLTNLGRRCPEKYSYQDVISCAADRAAEVVQRSTDRVGARE